MPNTLKQLIRKGVMVLFLFPIFTISCYESIPNAQNWNYAMNELGKWFATEMVYSFINDSGNYQVNYFVSDGIWFAAVISARKDTFGLVNSFVGKYEGNQLYYAQTDTFKVLSGAFTAYYDSLLASNACWRLLDSADSFNESHIRQLWERHIVFPSSDGSKGELYRSLILDKI